MVTSLHVSTTPAEMAIRRALGTQREQLLALIRRRAGARVDAEDVLHAAMARALERSEQLRDPARAEAWLRRVVQNVLSDELRRTLTAALSADSDEIPSADEQGLTCSCVLAQISRLKAEHADILRRVVVEGAPVTRVAAELGLTPNNAMVRLHRARAALRRLLEEHCGTTSIHACSECVCIERGCCATSAET